MYPSARKAEGGFTYLGLLLAVALFALFSSTTLKIGSTVSRGVAEQELLDAGLRLTRALESYARATPANGIPYPSRIEDLLRDPRYNNKVVRHLRRIEPDPMTGKADWVAVRAGKGVGITAFHSQSAQLSLRRELPAPFRDFNDVTTYREWVFTAGLGE